MLLILGKETAVVVGFALAPRKKLSVEWRSERLTLRNQRSPMNGNEERKDYDLSLWKSPPILTAASLAAGRFFWEQGRVTREKEQMRKEEEERRRRESVEAAATKGKFPTLVSSSKLCHFPRIYGAHIVNFTSATDSFGHACHWDASFDGTDDISDYPNGKHKKFNTAVIEYEKDSRQLDIGADY